MRCPKCGAELDLELIKKLEQKEKLLKLIYEDLSCNRIPIIPCFGDMETTEECETCLVESECVKEANRIYEVRHVIPFNSIEEAISYES